MSHIERYKQILTENWERKTEKEKAETLCRFAREVNQNAKLYEEHADSKG